MLKEVLFFLFIQFVLINRCAGQFEIFCKKLNINKVEYTIKNENLKFSNDFFFPCLDPDDSLTNKAFVPFKKIKKKNIWEKEFQIPIMCYLEDDSFSTIKQRVYTKNIKYYTVSLYSILDSVWYSKTFKPFFDGYQNPERTRIYKWERYNPLTKEFEYFLNQRSSKKEISKIKIEIGVKEFSSDFSFAIGELQILQVSLKEESFYHPLFESTTQSNFINSNKGNSLESINNLPFITTNYEFYHQFGVTDLFIKPIAYGYSEKELVYDVLSSIFKAYPYYSLRKIERDYVLSYHEQIKKYDYNTYIDSLIMYVSY